ncbi:MAG: flavodoxin domain-containing protein [Desulfatibacillum sp.]|nr:flavodoxin domain-containing protein [Desulfatibacillum sp.]
MKPLEIAKDIYWVGAIDWNIRDFHGYSTYQGTTYNAFLIVDEKITLIDAVKDEFTNDMFSRISQVVDPSRIDIVISNHTEMDHSGGLPKVMHRLGEDTPLYCSPNGMKNLKAHFHRDWNFNVVKSGDELSLGKRTLSFLETRMLHWPDSMFTYLAQDKILFSSDAFGQHWASLERFDDEIGHKIMPHAAKYYANILLPFSGLVSKLVDDVTKMGLEIDMICPDHGILWRQDPGKIIQAYAEWAKQVPQKKAVVVYDTMWHSTEKMADSVVEAFRDLGIEARVMHIRSCHRSDIMTEVMSAGAVVVGSPTINNNMFPTVADFLTYMKGLKPKNKVGGAFGSYGWSGEAAKQVNQELEAIGFELPHDPLRVQYVPDEDSLQSCYALGQEIGQALLKKVE